MNFYLRKCIIKTFCSKITKSPKLISACRLFKEIESNSKLLRKKELITNYLADFVKKINEDENVKEENFRTIGEMVKLSIPYLNMIEYKNPFTDKDEPFDVNLRYQYTFDLLIRTYISNKFEIPMSKIQEEYIKHGDLSKYLSYLFSSLKETEHDKEYLTIEEVLQYKEKIVKTIGNKSYIDKLELFSELISKCNDLIEIVYISRIFLNKLKIGLGERNVISCVLKLERYFSNKQNFRDLINFLEREIFKYQIYYPVKIAPVISSNFKDSDDNVDFAVTLRPGTFVDLQLGRHGMDLDKFMSSIQRSTLKCLVEIKYDGERSQMHFNGTEIQMASRSSQDQSILYQNLKQEIEREVLQYNKEHPYHQIKNFIIDGEIVSYSHKNKTFCHFQELRKKENVNEEKDGIQYFYVAFDILYLNDVNLYNLPLEDRKINLSNTFYKKFSNILVEGGKLINLQNCELAKLQITRNFEYSKKINCEGLVAKELGKTSGYHFGKRRWYKLKTLNESISDTLDLVPIAGLIGKGSSKSQMNSFLMAAYQPSDNTFIGVCKLGTGFDQKDLAEIQDRFTSHLASEIPQNYVIPRLLRPTFFFKPREVWEVGFDSFSESLNYSIGKGILNEEKGLSLRFPRFIRFRTDKSYKEANTPNDIVELYKDLNKKDKNDLIL